MSIVFADIWNDAPSYKYIEKPDDWISEVARNKAINYYNKHIKRQSKDVELESVSEIDTYRFLAEENSFSEIEFDAIINGLSEKEQRIVKLKIFYKYTHKEIAEELNMSHGTVCWAFNNALGKLRINLSEKNTS